MSLTKPKPRFKQIEPGSHVRHFSPAIRAEYDYAIMDKFLILTDNSTGAVSLTRFMSEALYELYYHKGIDVDKYKIIAMDFYGNYDAVIVKPIDKTNLTEVYYFKYEFKPIREKSLIQSIKIYNERYSKYWEADTKD